MAWISDKRQATVQLTVHAESWWKYHKYSLWLYFGEKVFESIPKNKIFGTKGFLLKFQKNAWVNEEISLRWTQTIWKQKPLNLASIQLKNPGFLHALSLRNTTLAFIPPGCTSLVQPLGVALNKPFKILVDAQYYEANLVDGHWAKYLQVSVAS